MSLELQETFWQNFLLGQEKRKLIGLKQVLSRKSLTFKKPFI
jgi:hypothetical protein